MSARFTTMSMFLGAVLTLGACGSTKPSAATPVSPKAPSETAKPLGFPELVDAVRRAADSPGDSSHAPIAGALRSLARVIDSLPAPLESATITAAADALTTRPQATNHLELVQRALRNAQRALERISGSDRRERFERLLALDNAVRELAPGIPLLEQRSEIIESLQAVANVVAVVLEEKPPFQLAVSRTAPLERSFDEALDDARAHALILARAEWMRAHLVAGSVIDDLASVVATLGTKAATQATELRLAAKRLQTMNQHGFEQARWIKEGLTAVVDALDDDSMAVRDARDAIASIELRTSITFQRGAIQDAVRATISAVSAQRNRCSQHQASRAR